MIGVCVCVECVGMTSQLVFYDISSGILRMLRVILNYTSYSFDDFREKSEC